MEQRVGPTSVFCVLAGFLVGASGCKMDDDDRCTSKFEWHPEQAACVFKSTDTEGEVDSVDTLGTDSSDAGDSSEDSEGSDEGPTLGLGEKCKSNEDCTQYAPDTCLLDPTNPDADGMCTFSACTAGGCPDSWVCCDCTSAGLFDWTTSFCFDPDSGALLGTVCDCG